MNLAWRNHVWALLVVFVFVACGPASAEEKIYIVTSLPDLADIATRIGGDLVTVESLAKGIEDPHGVPIKPSFVPKLNRAQVLIIMGLEYEHSWIPALVTESRNSRIIKGNAGYIDVSLKVTPKEVPTDLSRAKGELHPAGNPHFNLDPEGGRLIAQTIAEGLSANFPQHRKKFETNLKDFLVQLDAKILEWEVMARPLKGVKFISYHADFTYFADRFGLEYVGTIEFKPGIEYAAKLDRRRATNTRAQGLGWSKADTLKVVDPAEVDPGNRWRVERKRSTLSRIEDCRAFGGAIYRCKICAHTVAQWHHAASNCKVAHKESSSNQQLAFST